MNFNRLSGLVAATFTPFDAAGNINLPLISAYAKRMTEKKVAGVFVCGTTGESASLLTDERRAVAEAWIAAAEAGLKVIVHVGSNCQKEAIALARHAQQSGAYAIAAIAPSFFKPASVGALIDYFAPVAQAAPALPFYYYNMPSMTGVNLSVPDFLYWGRQKIPTLAGVKFTHNNLMEMAECLNLDGGAYEVLHGYDEILLTGVALGARAGVGSTYNYIPEVYQAIFEAVAQGDLAEARKQQYKSIEMVEIIIRYGGGVRGGKGVMKFAGIDCGQCRLPIAPFTDAEYAALQQDLKNIGFIK